MRHFCALLISIQDRKERTPAGLRFSEKRGLPHCGSPLLAGDSNEMERGRSPL